MNSHCYQDHSGHFLRYLTLLAVLLFSCSQRLPHVLPVRAPVSHAGWDSLLHQHVSMEGWVDYEGFIRDSMRLNRYLELLASAHPQTSWPGEEQMAYWINAYNAFTVKLIIQHYPVESIKDIKRGIPFVNTVWDIPFIHIQSETYDLNQIEHRILRKQFKDARIHAAINCASYSCPRLASEAFVADRLDDQLTQAMYNFIHDPLRNRIERSSVQVSPIFKWFGSDFRRDAGSLREYLNRYLETPVPAGGEISFLEYNWSLNDSARNHQ
ncbi:MAG: DUF547 domain-containing protein [Saprospiraceae bacterium]|nr:DUF547 domain-containing protein [Saprospiraceae bacterium]MCB9318187.1 DUF547 domain-containing protein [Lewinellaceae bacterium]